jgi:transcriptional repressor NrdR
MRRLETLVDEAESLLHHQPDRELSTRELGEFVMKRLRELDEVAYVRFASVYRKFEDIGAFLDEVDTLIREKSS